MCADQVGESGGFGEPVKTGGAAEAGEIVIREADLSDLDFLVQQRIVVLRAVFDIEEHEDTTALENANRAYYEKALKEGTHVAALAFEGEAFVGCGALCLQDEMPSPDSPSGRTALIMNVYTPPEQRHRGVARRVVRWLMERAQKKGVDRVLLEATPDARPLYEDLGFVSAPDFMEYRPQT